MKRGVRITLKFYGKDLANLTKKESAELLEAIRRLDKVSSLEIGINASGASAASVIAICSEKLNSTK